MKKIILLFILFISACALRAQDTIYPYEPGYPFYADSIQYFWETGPVIHFSVIELSPHRQSLTDK